MSSIIGENIKAARNRAGITQTELAELVGTDNNSISRWERGAKGCSGKNRARIAEVLNVTIEWLEQEHNTGLHTLSPEETMAMTTLLDTCSEKADFLSVEERNFLKTAAGKITSAFARMVASGRHPSALNLCLNSGAALPRISSLFPRRAVSGF